MASENAIATARERILGALAECDPLKITVPPLILALMAGYKSTDGKAYRIAFKRLKDEGILISAGGHVKLTDHGRTSAPRANPPSDDSDIQRKLLALLVTKPSKDLPFPPQHKTKAIFGQLLDGGEHTLVSLAQTAGYKSAKPMDSKAFRNLINRMKELGMLEKGQREGTWQFTKLAFPVKGRPEKGRQSASRAVGNKVSVSDHPSAQAKSRAPPLTGHSPKSKTMSSLLLASPTAGDDKMMSAASTLATASMPPLRAAPPSDGDDMATATTGMLPPLRAVTGSPADRKRAATPPDVWTPLKKRFKIETATTENPCGVTLPVVSELDETPSPGKRKGKLIEEAGHLSFKTGTDSGTQTNRTVVSSSEVSKEASWAGKETGKHGEVEEKQTVKTHTAASKVHKTKKLIKKIKKIGSKQSFWGNKPRV